MNSKKRILVVVSSPRENSNSTILALKASEGVEAAGGEADVIHIGNLNIQPCSACDACRNEPGTGCIKPDEMQPLYPKIREADGIVFATPIYWFNMSAQMKAFIDRTYAMTEGSKYGFTGKNVGVILSYADSDVFSSGGVNALRCFQDICAYVKANIIGMVYCTADKVGEVQANEQLLKAARSLGEKIVNARNQV